VIERDAISREAFADSHGEEGDFGAPDRRLVDLQSAPRQLKQLAAKLQASGVGLVLQFLEHGTGIPVLVAHLIDWGFPGMEGQPVSFEGSAADLDVERAAIAAVTEAAQAHTVTLLGAREVIEGADSPLERPQTLLRRNRLLFSGPNRSWGQIAGAARGRSLSRPEADLEAILAAIRDAGHEHAIAVDLTRPDLEIPVVRVLVSGMAQPYGFSTRRPPRRLLAGLA
jgi:ribosomal protein S12 methylthiotransferase accessory factor